MNDLQVFKNPQFGTLRTIEEDGKVLFVATDVAKILGYKRPADAVTAHCKGSVKRRLPTNGGVQEMKVIPEGDLYRLIVNSELPAAETFESWVFDEVLPTLSKTGSYSIKENPADDKSKQMRAEAMLLNAKSRQAKLMLEIAQESNITSYKEIMRAKAGNLLAGEPILPMPMSGRERKPLGWFCKAFGKPETWAPQLGKILAKKGIPKIQGQTGEWVENVAPHNPRKQVRCFEWYVDYLLPIVRELFSADDAEGDT